MPSYSYTAINDAGIKKKGILSADSEREARKLVKDLKLTPLKISESKNLDTVSYTHLRAHETREDLGCRVLG